MEYLIDYKSKEAYLNHQIEKAQLISTMKDHMKEWDYTVMEFEKEFKSFNIPKGYNILCVGSRYGEEVCALKNLGYESIGIDIIRYVPYTICMDMHNLKYEKSQFDMVYTNAIDHSNDVTKALSEMIRVVKEGGMIVIKVQLNMIHPGTYEVCTFDSINDITDIIEKLIKQGDLETRTSLGYTENEVWQEIIYCNIIKNDGNEHI